MYSSGKEKGFKLPPFHFVKELSNIVLVDKTKTRLKWEREERNKKERDKEGKSEGKRDNHWISGLI